MTCFHLRANPRRPRAGRHAGHAAWLGSHAARFEGRHLVRPRLRRLVLPSGAGGRAEHAAELRRRSRCTSPPAARSRSPATSCRRRRRASRSRCRRARVDVDRLGRGSRLVPDPAEAAHARVPARGRAPAPAHQRDRRGHARARRDRACDPPLLPRQRLLLDQHADHHGVGRRRRRRAVPRVDARPREPAAHRGQARSTTRRISSAARRS